MGAVEITALGVEQIGKARTGRTVKSSKGATTTEGILIHE